MTAADNGDACVYSSMVVEPFGRRREWRTGCDELLRVEACIYFILYTTWKYEIEIKKKENGFVRENQPPRRRNMAAREMENDNIIWFYRIRILVIFRFFFYILLSSFFLFPPRGDICTFLHFVDGKKKKKYDYILLLLLIPIRFFFAPRTISVQCIAL